MHGHDGPLDLAMKRIFLLAIMACYLCFAYFLYNRWVATELAYRGPVPFVALLELGPDAMPPRNATGVPPPPRVSWFTVLTPLWVADSLTILAHATLLVVQHAWRPSASSLNAKLEHASGATRAVLYAVFKVLLLDRLAPPQDGTELRSWWTVFTPVYIAAVVQMILHSCKTLEGSDTLFVGRNAQRPRRRPGFALTLDDTLAFNISLYLNGGACIHAWRIIHTAGSRTHPAAPPRTPHMPAHP